MFKITSNYFLLFNKKSFRLSHIAWLSSVNIPECASSKIKINYKEKGSTWLEQLVNSMPRHYQPYMKLMRLDRPIGTWLLYIPCTWGIALATPLGQLPSLYMLALFGTGAVLMRGAGCTINDMWDRDFDKHVDRTRNRPITSGDVSLPKAFIFLGAQMSLSLAILLQFNWYSVFLGLASTSLVVSYPLFKRFTYWPQIVLGCTLNCGIFVAYAALAGCSNISVCLPIYFGAVMWTLIYDTIYGQQVSLITPSHHTMNGFTFNYGALLGYSAVAGSCLMSLALPLYISGLCWTMVYDTIYALQDIEDDKSLGLKSTAIYFGENSKKWMSGFGLGMAGLLTLTGYNYGAGPIYFTGISLAMLHIVYQLYSLDIHDRMNCLYTFKSNRNTGLVVFSSIVLDRFFNSGLPMF